MYYGYVSFHNTENKQKILMTSQNIKIGSQKKHKTTSKFFLETKPISWA